MGLLRKKGFSLLGEPFFVGVLKIKVLKLYFYAIALNKYYYICFIEI